VTRAVCAVVLAAGKGTRLRPLTVDVPKALCPVGNVPLLDLALARLAAVGLAGPAMVAVNACYLGGQVAAHVGNRAHVSMEPGEPLGTGGGVANLRDWIAGRGVLVLNADAYLVADDGDELAPLLADWDGATARLLGVPTTPTDLYRFGGHRFARASLLAPADVAAVPDGPGELVHSAWRPAEAAGRLEVIEFAGTYLDTGTPADYLAANLHAAGAGSLVAVDAEVHGELDRAVVGAGARVFGRITRGVVWPGGYVGPDEQLVDVIRRGRDETVPAH
jgi:N-acetyl-alpha-D-muramate 1-phosphate uridylyltransferase